MMRLGLNWKNYTKSLKNFWVNKDKQTKKPLIKFRNLLKWLSNNQLVSSVQSFGDIFVNWAGNRIKVQPKAVTWRKLKIGSRKI